MAIRPNLPFHEMKVRGQEDVVGRSLRKLSNPTSRLEEEQLCQGHFLRDVLNLPRFPSFSWQLDLPLLSSSV